MIHKQSKQGRGRRARSQAIDFVAASFVQAGRTVRFDDPRQEGSQSTKVIRCCNLLDLFYMQSFVLKGV